jgi:hypothetical protein
VHAAKEAAACSASRHWGRKRASFLAGITTENLLFIGTKTVTKEIADFFFHYNREKRGAES